MGAALSQLARTAHVQLLYPFQLARIHGINPVNGRYSVAEALEILLRGTGFSGGLTSQGVVTISLRKQGCGGEGSTMLPNVKSTTSVLALLFGAVGAPACYAQGAAAGGADNAPTVETVVVTGYRASLEKALDIKRNSMGVTDSVFAEDIGKFPDMNVAESLQRIPGVALQRGSGEGEQITVRGLGPQFTRVRINGMEAMATTMDSANGTNRGRGFDFNVFASELFSQLTVNKTTAAEVEEGSLGATVDLRTAHPFDHSGFLLTGSAQAGYHDFAGSTSPRVALMASNVFLGGRLGILISGAFEKKNTLENGSSTVGWDYGESSSLKFGSVMGATSGDEYNTVNAAYSPRMPRYEIVRNKTVRMGFTGSVQWQPDDRTMVTLDAMYADFSTERHTYDLEAYAFSVSGSGSSKGTGLPVTLGHKAINVVDYTLDSGRNSLLSLSATNVGLRNEARLDHLDTRFMQTTLEGTHDFSEKFKVRALLGWSESHHRNPIQTTVTADYNCTDATSVTGSTEGCPEGQAGGAGSATNPYVYSYVGSNMLPYINYGNVDVTDTNGWFLSQIRERSEFVFNSFRSAQMDAEYAPSDSIKLHGGLNYKNYGFRTYELRRSNGSTANLDYSIPADIRNTSPSEYSTLVSLKNIGAPSGTASTWWVPNIEKFNSLFSIWDGSVYDGAFHMGAEPGLNNSGGVVENDYGAWLQANWYSAIYGIPFSGNVGVRYVLTDQWASGYSYDSTTKTLLANEKTQTYHDFLPSFNMVLEPAENFLIRLNGSYAMARPDLSSLMPKASVTVSGSSLGVSLGNPILKPFRSKNIDLSYEWYYHKGAMLSMAFFYKKIDSFVQTLNSNIVFHDNPYGLSDDLVTAACGSSYGTSCNENLKWTFTRPVNTKGGPLYGTEISWQQPLDFLPGLFSNLGVMANATFIQATQKYLDSNNNVIANADLTNLSRNTFNGTFYYDDKTLQMRVTVSNRSKYLNSVPASYDNDYGVTRGSFNVDAAASYKFDDHLMVTLDAVNLTDESSFSYVDSVGKRANSWSKTGRVFYLGVKYDY